MNRFDIVFSSSDHPLPASSVEFSWPRDATPSSADARQTATMEIITRRIKPGSSIRRLRNHRCPWPRRC